MILDIGYWTWSMILSLQERMKTVEARALNLTSKLLLKEMDIGLLKKEKIRLESQVQMQKEKEEKQEKVSTMKLLDKKETKISLANLTKSERKEPTLMSTNNSVGERSSSEQSDVKEQIVDKLLDIKKKQHELETDKEQVIEKAEKVERDTDKEEIVDKLVDIKKKQQELEEAKKDFFSDTVGETASSEGKVISENTIAESENVKTNDSINTERKNETLTLNVNQEDIQSLIELPDPSNFTKEPTPPLPSTMSTLSSNLPSPAPISPLKVLDPLSNGSIVVNTLNGTSVAGYNGTDQEKKIHIILDVSNKENT